MAQKEKRGIALWAYRIRGAKLHRAIFHLLGDKQPQTTRQIGKTVANKTLLKNTSASTVNKSVRNLQQHGPRLLKELEAQPATMNWNQKPTCNCSWKPTLRKNFLKTTTKRTTG